MFPCQWKTIHSIVYTFQKPVINDLIQIVDVLYPTYTISDFCKISNFRITIRIFGEFFREFKYCESAISCMLNVNSWNRDVMAAVSSCSTSGTRRVTIVVNR
jgi:hypothetical protein